MLPGRCPTAQRHPRPSCMFSTAPWRPPGSHVLFFQGVLPKGNLLVPGQAESMADGPCLLCPASESQAPSEHPPLLTAVPESPKPSAYLSVMSPFHTSGPIRL